MLALLKKTLDRRTTASRELQHPLVCPVNLVAHPDVAVGSQVDLLETLTILPDDVVSSHVWHEVGGMRTWEWVNFALLG